MEFSGQYLTYLEYKALGGTLAETPFNILEFEARNLIDIRTQNRLVNETEIPSKVKLCDFDLINQIYKFNTEASSLNTSNTKVNETTDGYSVTYITADQVRNVIELHKYELEDIMLKGLYGVVVNNVAILYDGVF